MMIKRRPRHEVTKNLVDVAMGRRAADLIIRNGRWVSVHSGEIIAGTDVAIYQSRIAFVGEDAAHAIGDETEILVGNSRKNMAKVANRLVEVGVVVCFREGQEIALVELPIAGLMSNEPAEIVARKAERLIDAFAECGCNLNNAFMQLSLLPLVVIPELRVSDLGIVDVKKFEIVPLLVTWDWGISL